MKARAANTVNLDPAHVALDQRHGAQAIAKNVIIGFLLVVYTIITITPFYFLAIRSLTPTREATKFHLWVPEAPAPNLDAGFGDTAIFLNLNIRNFKEDFGISGYIAPQLTFRDIAAQYQISEAELVDYLQPFIRYNGWFTVLRDPKFLRALYSSVIIAGASLALGGFLGICTGSALARFRRRWHLFVYNSYLLQIIIPPVMTMLPVYIIMARFLHIDNTYLSVILMYIKGGAISTMIFTSYIATIPTELKESVDVDGGNRFHYFGSIVLPLSRTPLAAFLAVRLPVFWNWLLYPLLLLSPEKYNLVAYLTSLRGENQTNFQALFAGLAISMIPLLLIYLVFQKLFVRSALSGAVKG